jgi:hypothetical protein
MCASQKENLTIPIKRVVSVECCTCGPEGFTPLKVIDNSLATGKKDWMPEWNRKRGEDHLRKHPDHNIELTDKIL